MQRWRAIFAIVAGGLVFATAVSASTGPAAARSPAADPAHAATATREGTVHGVARREAAVPWGTARTSPYPLRRIPWQRRWGSNPAIKTEFPELTPSGVCMDHRTDPPRPHPIVAARCGQAMWNNYRLTGDRSWLRKAAAQGTWLINFRREHGGGWFYPYLWDHGLSPSRTMGPILLRKPWYSAMAQGEVLALFVRLSTSTGDPKWRTAAAATFSSLLVAPRVGRPWATWIHDGYLWLEETTFADTPTGDRILNGHMFALFGAYDYWLLTGDRRAAALIRAALVTSLEYAERLRVPYWRSYYDDHRRGESNAYHYTHARQLLYLGEMTGHASFVRAAIRLWTDAQPPVTTGTVVVRGEVSVYQLRNGRPSLVRTKTLPRASTAPLASRDRIRGSSHMWLRPAAGTFTGMYLPETPGRTYVQGMVADLPLRLPLGTRARRATVRYHYYDARRRALTRYVDASPGVGARIAVNRFAYIAGVPHFQVRGGPAPGYWVPYSHVTG